jgi:hypothetical protein
MMYSVHEIDLAPFERALWTIRSIRGTRLDTLDKTDVLDLVNWAIAAIVIATAGNGSAE